MYVQYTKTGKKQRKIYQIAKSVTNISISMPYQTYPKWSSGIPSGYPAQYLEHNRNIDHRYDKIIFMFLWPKKAVCS
jgi:hypothetical protein